MIRIKRAAGRFISENKGIRTLHWYSSGPHYDPDRMGVGSIVGYDEHLIQPGCGFESHRHRRVDIYTWVLEGKLRHADDAGNTHVVSPGMLQIQRTGTGIEHSEVNASDTEPLRFLQVLILPQGPLGEPRYFAGSYAESVHQLNDVSIHLVQLSAEQTYETVASCATHIQILGGDVAVKVLESDPPVELCAGDCLEFDGEFKGELGGELEETALAMTARHTSELLVIAAR